MASKQKRDGDTLEFTVATTARTTNQMEKVGRIVGVHLHDAAIGATATLARKGVFTGIAKLSTDVVTQGAPLFWDDTNKRLTLSVGASGVNAFAGWADADAGNGVTTVDIILSGGSATIVSS